MGKAGRWLKGILGVGLGTNKGKKQSNVDHDFEISSFTSCDNHHIKDKKRWSFSRNTCHHEFLRPRPSLSVDSDMEFERSRRGIVRLTADPSQLYWAASRIQATFRGFLARKALKALKGIVKLQSLIRGCMARKHAAAAGRVVQARAVGIHRCGCHSFDKENVFDSSYWPRRSIERIDETRSSFHSRRNSYSCPKIVGVDTIKQPHARPSKLNRNDPLDFDRSHLLSTAQGLPLCRSYVKPVMLARSVSGEFPVLEKPVCPEYPNYMARTQSFEAKLRSTRIPKKKQPIEESRRRLPLREIASARNSITSMDMQRSFSHYERYTF